MNVDHDPLPGDHPGTERVSTGVLPPDTDVQAIISAGYERFLQLDEGAVAAGNSVRGQRITRYLSEALGLNLFASAPAA
jgi:hypothetical protein